MATATTAAPTTPQYTAAYDSLMHQAATLRADVERRLSFFSESHGSMGGLHSRVRSYSGNKKLGLLVKKQVIKQRYGVELKKVAYFDSRGRLTLSERYEAGQLTRLELREYPRSGNATTGRWLLVRGQYLRRDAGPMRVITPTGEAKDNRTNSSFFFNTLSTVAQ